MTREAVREKVARIICEMICAQRGDPYDPEHDASRDDYDIADAIFSELGSGTQQRTPGTVEVCALCSAPAEEWKNCAAPCELAKIPAPPATGAPSCPIRTEEARDAGKA